MSKTRPMTASGPGLERPLGARVARRPGGYQRWLLSAPLIIFLLVIAVFPAGLGIWIAMTDRSILSPDPQWVGLTNFGTILTDERFWGAAWFTVWFTVLTTVCVLATGFGLAVLVNRRFPGKRVLFTALLLPIMIAPALMGLMFRSALNSDIGLAPSFLRTFGVDVSLFDPKVVVPLIVILEILQWTAFTFLILYSGLQAMPEELYEAAALDGASKGRAMRSITLPLMAPVFFAAGFLRAVDALRTFDVIFVLTGGGPGTVTTTLSIYVYKKAFIEGQFGLATAAALLIMLLILPLVPIVMKRVTADPGAAT